MNSPTIDTTATDRAMNRESALESLPAVDPSLLESANIWFDRSWYGLLICGAATAFAAMATVAFLFLQYWSSGVRERHTEWRTSALELEISKANKRAGELANEAEQLRAKNLAFEKALVPRNVEQNLAGQALKRYPGLAVIVRSSNDVEARRTAGQIRWLLRAEAGWGKFSGTISDPSANPKFFRDGIVVRPGLSSLAREAALRLIEVLKEGDIDARIGPPSPDMANGIFVAVGLRQLPPSLQVDPDKMPADARGKKSWGNILEDDE